MPDALDIQDYLDATSASASRARSTAIALVVASVLMFSGLLNSLQHSWMLERLHEWSNVGSEYVTSKIGSPPPADSAWAIEAYRFRYRELYASLSRTYIDNAYVVRVPFFGFAVDVNDLGMIGGVAFVIMLTMLRFSLSREVDNLKTSFKEARRLEMASEFYVLLSMRQVFTVPKGEAIRRGKFMIWVPKAFIIAPLTVYAAVMAHDIVTGGVGNLLNKGHTLLLYGFETLLLAAISTLTVMVLRRMKRVDDIWDGEWKTIVSDRHRKGDARSAPRQ